MKRNLQQLGEVAASLGAALLVAGYLRYSIEGNLEKFSDALLIAGAVLFVAGLGMCYRGIMNFFSKRSSQMGTNTFVLVVGVLIILGIINYFGFQYKKTFDLTTEKLYTLSDQTKKTVGGLKTDVDVVRFAKTADPTFNALMPEYHSLSSHLKYETVDPEQKPDIAKDYGATTMGDVIVSSGDRKQAVQNASEGNLGEEDITSAILKVTQAEAKNACFITGHGEKSTADTQEHGYSTVSDGLKKEGYDVKDVNLVTSNGVPSDCSLIVDAGPTKPFFPQEVQMVTKYLDGGGKALLMVDPGVDPKLDDIFNAWNIKLGDNVVVDVSGIGQLIGAGPAIPLVTDYGDSPITKNMARQMTFFPEARTVDQADKSKTDPQIVQLLKTSSRSFTTPKLAAQVKYDPKTDQTGPLTLGVAASGLGAALNSRLVVIGDSDFASNSGVGGPGDNSDLFFNTIDWLAQQENQISIRPKQATNRQINMTEAQSHVLTWLDLFLIPGLLIISGITVWWRRR